MANRELEKYQEIKSDSSSLKIGHKIKIYFQEKREGETVMSGLVFNSADGEKSIPKEL